MPQEKKIIKEERKDERCPIKLSAQLEISLSNRYTGNILQDTHNIIAMVETCNISIEGILLRIVGSPMDVKKSITRTNAFHLIHKPIEVVFSDEGITVWGKVVRVDVNMLEIAIVINKVSDIQRWKKLCSKDKGTLV
jgi:hypothetical protein